MSKKAFTLVEVLISLVIAGILFGLIFKSYVSITQISTRLGNEKKLNAEIAFMTETVQNIADVYQIDFPRYSGTLEKTYGRTDTLYLTGNGTGGMMLTLSGNNIYRVASGGAIPLISSGSASISQGKFKIIPFIQNATGNVFVEIQHPGFRLFANFQLARFNPKERIWNVQSSLQQFYNLQRVE